MSPLTKNSRRAGFTLLEALVVIFLMAIAMTLLGGLFFFGSKLMSRGGNRVDASRAAVGFSRELKSYTGCPLDQVTTHYPSGDPTQGDLMISFPNHRRPDGTRVSDPLSGLPMVQSFEVYYRTASDTIRHHRLSPVPSAVPLTPTSSELQGIFDSNLGIERLQRCRAFQLMNRDSGQATGAVTGLLEVHLELESTDAQWVKLDTHLRLLP